LLRGRGRNGSGAVGGAGCPRAHAHAPCSSRARRRYLHVGLCWPAGAASCMVGAGARLKVLPQCTHRRVVRAHLIAAESAVHASLPPRTHLIAAESAVHTSLPPRVCVPACARASAQWPDGTPMEAHCVMHGCAAKLMPLPYQHTYQHRSSSGAAGAECVFPMLPATEVRATLPGCSFRREVWQACPPPQAIDPHDPQNAESRCSSHGKCNAGCQCLSHAPRGAMFSSA